VPFNWQFERRTLYLTEALIQLGQGACRWKEAKAQTSYKKRMRSAQQFFPIAASLAGSHIERDSSVITDRVKKASREVLSSPMSIRPDWVGDNKQRGHHDKRLTKTFGIKKWTFWITAKTTCSILLASL
jgi:hypothetical protein